MTDSPEETQVIASKKGGAVMGRFLLVVVSAVVAVAVWPTIRNFVAHNTRTQVHRINT